MLTRNIRPVRGRVERRSWEMGLGAPYSSGQTLRDTDSGSTHAWVPSNFKHKDSNSKKDENVGINAPASTHRDPWGRTENQF